jgi:hypothetical protein
MWLKLEEGISMASRREFLQVGLASLALPISAHAAFSSEIFPESRAGRVTPLYKVVYDQRFAASRMFAQEASDLGATLHPIQGDITDLWFHDLYARWKQSPVAIAGLTAQGPLFCLERLAWDHGMRVVFRADHSHQASGLLEHTLAVPEAMARRAAQVADRGAEWPRWMAGLATHCPADLAPAEAQAAKATITAPAPHELDTDEALISWVIAPVVRS